MKNLKIGLIAILSALIISLLVILAYGMAGRNLFGMGSRQDYGKVQLVLEEEIPLGGIDCISVLYGLNSNDIYLLESENDALTIREYSSHEMNAEELSTIKTEGNSLTVRGRARGYESTGFHLFNLGGAFYDRHYTEIYLPQSWQGELLLETASGNIASEMELYLEKDFSVVSTSGDVVFPSVTAQNISVYASSGNIRMEDLDTNVNDSVGNIDINTTSGDVNLNILTGKTVIGSTSGNLTVGTILGNAQLGTSSGDVNVGEITGETEADSTSGNLTIGTILGNAQLDTTSGDMNIGEITGETKADSASGNLTIKVLIGNLQVRTTSGDVNIQHIDGDVQANTVSGNASILEGSGDRSVTTSSGDVIVEGMEGAFLAHTQSGSVGIVAEKGTGSIETVSGDIRLELQELAGALSASSSSGFVSITLGVENEFDFTAETVSGDIVTFFDGDLTFSSKRNQAQGTYGGNGQGNRMEIQTSSGDVRISKYQ